MNKEKQIQIPETLFMAIYKHMLLGDNTHTTYIQNGLKNKIDAMIRHDLYSKYKTAPTETEQETARQAYLEAKGIPENFRW